MSYKIDNCQLEVDAERGVVYVHGPDGVTLLRVCKIPAYAIKTVGMGKDLTLGELIDVTDWRWRDKLKQEVRDE
mgnify:CR=1 FL=1